MKKLFSSCSNIQRRIKVRMRLKVEAKTIVGFLNKIDGGELSNEANSIEYDGENGELSTMNTIGRYGDKNEYAMEEPKHEEKVKP